MRTIFLTLLAVSVCAQARARQRYVIPVRDGVGVYEHRIRQTFERPLYEADTDERLVFLSREGRFLKVKDTAGRIGWVERRLAAVVAASTGVRFGETLVRGYEDTPYITPVIDRTGAPERPLLLRRAFDDELRINVDREELRRSVR